MITYKNHYFDMSEDVPSYMTVVVYLKQQMFWFDIEMNNPDNCMKVDQCCQKLSQKVTERGLSIGGTLTQPIKQSWSKDSKKSFG